MSAPKPGRDATLPEILRYVARHPRLWTGFARVLARHIAAKTRLHVACWSSGYTVREVRRMVQDGES